MTVYGITTCRQTQKAMAWFRKNNIEFVFHDYKKVGITAERLQLWDKKVDHETFFNKKGSTWKKLDEVTKEAVHTKDDVLNLLLRIPTIIKRPGIEDGDFLYFGYDEKVYEEHFQKTSSLA